MLSTNESITAAYQYLAKIELGINRYPITSQEIEEEKERLFNKWKTNIKEWRNRKKEMGL